MSTSADPGLAGCRPTDGTPVTIDAAALDSTAPRVLRSLKRALDTEGFVPAALEIHASFGADCSLTTQAEVDRVRDLLRAADFLGVGTVYLRVESVADRAKVRPALAALTERAQRQGLTLELDADDL